MASLAILMLPVGSHGDVHPFVGLAKTLMARGHEVTIGVNEFFAPSIRRAGIDVLETGTADDYRTRALDPDLWHPRRGTPRFLDLVVRWGLRPHYDAVSTWLAPSRSSVVVASSFSLGARVAHDVLGVPLVTVHLQPHLLISKDDPPIGPGLPEGAPRWYRHLVHRLLLRYIFDPRLSREVNAFRAELGLARVDGIAGRYWNSPQRIIGLYPPWFASPQRDWPEHASLTSFPLYDESGAVEFPRAVEEFLEAGSPPIAFTPGSAMRVGEPFFAAAAEACRLLGRRGMLLTRFVEQIPPELPEGVRHFDYVPFSALLPRTAALVHHGGIGTLAQAMLAGVPQLISPMAHDQFDNSARARRLGVALELPRKRFVASRLAARLEALLGDTALAERCRERSRELVQSHALADAAGLIEQTFLESRKPAPVHP